MAMIGKQIQYYRKREKLSQQDLADRLCMSRQAISNWERNISEPDIDSITKLSNIFHIHVDTLLQIDDTFQQIERQKKLTRVFGLSLLFSLIYKVAICFKGTHITNMIFVVILNLICGTIITAYGYCIKNQEFSLIAGYDDHTQYNEKELNHFLLDFEMYLLQVFVSVLILSFIMDIFLDIVWMPALGCGFLVLDIFVSIIVLNIKYREKMFLNEKDQQNAKRMSVSTIVVFLDIVIFIIFAFVLASLRHIENNSGKGMLFGLWIMIGILLNIGYLFYADWIVKKDKEISLKNNGIFVFLNLIIWICMWVFI